MPERLIGRIADVLVHLVIGILVTLPAQGDLDAAEFSVWAMGAATLMFVWETVWVASTGASVGKHLAGTRVEPASAPDDMASPPGAVRSALRALPRLLWGFPLGVVVAVPFGLISLIMLFVWPRRRTPVDLLAGTVVVTRTPVT